MPTETVDEIRRRGLHPRRSPRSTMKRTMATAKPNKHVQRTLATREKLLRAAETIFVRDGYEGAELGEIAALAGRTKGAIYAHYKSKEDIFLALIRERSLEYKRRMAELIKSSTSTNQNRELFRKQCLSMVEDPVWAMLLLEFKLYAMRHPESKAHLNDYYAELLPEGQEKRFAELLGSAGSGADALSRSAAVRILGPLLSSVAIEATFAPRLLDAATRRKVAERVFDVLLPADRVQETAAKTR